MRIATAIGLLVALPACKDGKHYYYPPTYVQSFMNECSRTSNGNTEVCGCMLEGIQRRFTFAEFNVFETKIAFGQTSSVSDAVTETIAECRIPGVAAASPGVVPTR